MSILYKLDPEVAGELGNQSRIVYKNGIIDNVIFLHYEFSGWLGDDLVTSTPCFIVSKSLADDIIKHKLMGCRFEQILQTKSDNFVELYPNIKLPEFIRIIPEGIVKTEGKHIKYWSGHDFCLEDGVDLYVTKRALDILEKYKIDNCDIEEKTKSWRIRVFWKTKSK